jgi:acyl-CoA synthetase (AMP-forming)/AMP-acid ligase II
VDLAAHGLIPPDRPPRDPAGPGTVGQLLGDLDAASGRDVLIGRQARFTAGELKKAVDRATAALQALGIGPGDRVAVSLPNDADIVITFLATIQAGALWVGINRSLATPEKTYLVADSESALLLAEPDTAESMRAQRADLPELRRVLGIDPDEPGDDWREALGDAPEIPRPVTVDPLDPAAIAYTSGTTGFPKGAVHTQHNLLLPGTVTQRRDQYPKGGVLGVPLPLTVLNLIVLGPLVTLQNDMTLVAMDRIDAVGMAEWIQAEQITTFAAVPAMVHDLLNHPEVSDQMLASLDGIGVGGADMPDAFRRLYADRFGRSVGTGYGLTEAPTAVTLEDPEETPVPGTCGKALPQVCIHILDDRGGACAPGEVGEVCVGPATDGPFIDCYRPMLGYWNQPEASREALAGGLLHTGDLGTLDDEGHLFIKDRKHDLIIRGGANVYPAEVERALHEDPGVAACAVIGLPDDRLGERVAAFVQVVDGADLDETGLRSGCEQRLAVYKVPDTIRFVDDFDRTPMGKIRKTTLRAMVAAGMGARS